MGPLSQLNGMSNRLFVYWCYDIGFSISLKNRIEEQYSITLLFLLALSVTLW